MTQPQKTLRKKDGQWDMDGFLFDKQKIANQMAYLFSGIEGQKRARAIREEAEKIQDPTQRKVFIEEEVKKKGKEVEEGLFKGIVKHMDTLPRSGKDLSGPDAGKDLVVDLMKSLGLNVDPDNVQTHYTPGPPQTFHISWINRPSVELKNEHSEINQLSSCYANTLSPEERTEFDANWGNHVAQAKNDGPKVPKTTFEMNAAKSWADFKNSTSKEKTESAEMTDEHDLKDELSAAFKI
ncbi:hypothetical protein Lmor_2992 [Legionella moravica]|uniref:Uncharacterized protein n=1 Tax=Legionella moravica TaxID=39962 RepID=A0A378K0Y4_9GAMM|nr:hypothetical protein [Legionella moravica]KTD30885.1 hypothetical protein Lmor_2992 [Legionella moravica]STX63288.1 Uncharacterised protein [Legionella moravica]